MNEIATYTVRKKSSANVASMLLVVSIVALVFFGVNIYAGKKSPMWNMNVYFVIIMIVFFVWWLIVHMRMKLTLTLSKDHNGHFFISIPLKDGTEIKANRVIAIEPIWARVTQVKGPKLKEIYLKIFDENNINAITLYGAKGAIHEAPDGFWEMDERDFLGYDKGVQIYTSNGMFDLFNDLIASKSIEVRFPR